MSFGFPDTPEGRIAQRAHDRKVATRATIAAIAIGLIGISLAVYSLFAR